MFNIALISQENVSDSSYIEALNEILKKKNIELHYFNLNELDQNICMVDAVIIKEKPEGIGEICELLIKIRNLSDCFIWILSKTSTKVNRSVYLQLGSDGIFDEQIIDSDEFGIYIEMFLSRRIRKVEEEKEEAPIVLIPSNFSMRVKSIGEISLTKREFQVMEILLANRGVTVSYEEMQRAIWKNDKEDHQYLIANLIFHIRQKLGDDSFKSDYIRTIRSKGYMLVI
jgi:DNA-binding response OmpR family regulator